MNGNILNVFPQSSWYNIISSLLMSVTCISSFPLYLNPVHEVIEGDWGMNAERGAFITKKKIVIFRTIEIACVSMVAALIPSFSDVLGFNILYIIMKMMKMMNYP